MAVLVIVAIADTRENSPILVTANDALPLYSEHDHVWTINFG